MLWPSLVMSTSPGLIAASPGMFSVIGAIAVTLAPTPSAAAAPRAPRTMAAPDMSVFMVVMPSAVLSDSPPESKVMPLPTSTMWAGSPLASGGT